MSKTSKRVLSWVMTVLMVVSMLSSFAIPAFAADAAGPDVANAYYVSHTFTSGNVSFTWEGNTVNGTVGTNAFATIDAAIQAAKAKGNNCPDIIVPSWNGSNLIITGGCRVYAPNWNTVPYLRDTQDGEWKAVNSNGADWTENPDYFDSQVTINNLIIEGTASGVVEVYGFTQIDGLFEGGNTTKRTTSSPKIDILVKNGVANCNVTTKNGGSFLKGYNNTSIDQNDSLTIENFYFKWARTGGNSRLFGDTNMPAHVTLDGVWMDYDTCGFIRHDFTKTTGKNSSITIKNSNIRNMGKNHTGTNSDNTAYNRWNYICFGAFNGGTVLGNSGTISNDITFENNVFYNANNTDSATNRALIHIDENGVGSLTIKDNYAINTGDNLMKVLNKRMPSANSVIGDGDVKITGNKFLGFADSFVQPDDKKEVIDNNFLVTELKDSAEEYATVLGSELKADTGLANGSTGAYYLDYDMKYISTDFELKEVKIGAEDEITIDGSDIMVNTKQGGAAVTPAITAKGDDVAVKISTKADFSDTVTTVDTSVKESVATYYVRAYSKTDANVYLDYVLTVAVEKSKEVIEFESEDAYIINKDWTDEQLAGDADLTIWFNGKDRTVNPKTNKLFNSFDKAHDAAFANLTEENYFTLNPIFVFGPGDYSASIVHIPANATIYGSNAGVSPNAKNPADATIDSIKADGGIAANPDFNLDKATKLGYVMFTTRIDDGSGTKWNVVDTSEAGAKWQGMRDAALKADPTAELVLTVDGILQGGQLQMSGFDTGNKYTYNGTSNISPVQGREYTVVLKNSKVTANTPISAWNTTWHYQHFVFDSVRIDTNIDNFGQRFIDTFTIKNSYLTKQTSSGALFKVWTGETSGNASMRRDAGTLNIEESVLYDNSNAYFTLDMDSLHDNKKVINFNLTDSVLYNAGNANWGIFAFYNREDFNRTLNVKITGNEIYHDKNSNTLFNGNNTYLTKGKTNITFTNNKVIGTLSNVAPNAQYTDAQMKALFSHNFNDNFVSTAKDGVAKVPGYAAGGFPTAPNSGYTANTEWNYNDPIYYLDFDFKYKNTDAEITAATAGEGNYVTVEPRIITANVVNKTGVINASNFTVGANNTVTIKDGSTTVSSIDLTKISGVKDYTVYVGINGAAANVARTYTLRVIDGAVDFNAALKNGGITYGDKTFTAANTVAFAPSGQSTYTDENGKSYFYQYFNGTLYKYTIDNENVFAWATKAMAVKQIGKRNGSEGTLVEGDIYTWSRTGLDLDKVKAKAENGNIILAGENFSASSAQLVIPYATSIYGLNAGINPVNKAGAVAVNDYKASISSEWGQHGQTTIGTLRIGNAKDGDIVLDGVTLTERVYDTVRYEMYDSKDEALNVTFKNIVVNAPAASGGALFVLSNALTTIGCGAGNGDGGGALPVDDEAKAFGEVYNDSFTLENCYMLKASVNQVVDELCPPNLTVRNFYCDAVEAGRKRELFGFIKRGIYAKTQNVVIEDSIFRNSVGYNQVLHVEGARNDYTPVDDTYDCHVTYNNNIIFKSGKNQAFVVKAKAYNTITITNNTVVACNDTQKFLSSYADGSADKYAAEGNITISGNKLVGFTNERANTTAFKLNDYTPVFANGYVSEDVDAYKTNKVYNGIYVDAMADEDYYVDFGMTAKASEFAITKFEAGTSGVSDITVDSDNREIQLSLARGTTEGISIVLSDDNAKWYFSTDAAGKNKLDLISREDLKQLVSTYYFNIEVNGVVLTYEVEVLNDVVPDFADVTTFDPAYFSNNAVIITDKAANLAAGTEIFEEWDGQWYRFYAGVNAFDTYSAALASSAVPEILVTKATQENGVLNVNLDLVVSKSMKLFTPNYKTNPVISDGYGTESPTQGAGWGYNTAFDAHKDDVRIKSISTWTPAGDQVAEFYGLTIDSAVNDNGRQVGSTMKMKFVNTLFTTSKGSGYIFTNQSTAGSNKWDYIRADQENELYVKNAYFGSDESITNFRLMGELIPAKVTFDNIYLDMAEAGFTNTSYIKHTAKDSSITFKNSYINGNYMNGNNGHLQFEGLLVDGGNGLKGGDDKEKATLPEGYNAAIVFENNIIEGSLGYTNKSGTFAMFRMNGASFNKLVIKDNYLNIPQSISVSGTPSNVKTTQLWWSMQPKASENGGNITNLPGEYTVTGNVINGFTVTGVDYSNGGTDNALAGFDVTFYDNFIGNKIGANAYAADSIGVAGSTQAKDQSGVGYYRLTADGSKLSNVIQDMTWSERVSFSGNTAIANIYDCDNIYTVTENANADDPTVIDSYTYSFDLSSLIKKNVYGNNISVAFGDGVAVDLETEKLEITRETQIAADTAIRVTVTVDSPDNRADEQTYTFVIFMNSGDAPAFKGSYVDEAGIISDSAVIVTPAASGATGTINAQWLGETYSFTVGENAFATVEDALAYAKDNADKYADAPIEILLAESDKTTDLTITYPAKIYGVNYNTVPYITDGYGTESPSHGTNWYVNGEYTDDQTHVDVITLDASFPTGGVLEINGVTIHGSYYDTTRAAGNVADVSFKNIVMDLDGTVRNHKYVWNLESAANLNTAGNKFTMTNVYVKSLGSKGGWIYGERTPETATFDGLWIPNMASAVPGDNAYMKAGKAAGLNSVVTYKNCNFQNQTVAKSRLYPDGDDNTSKTKFVFDNNIFNNYYGLSAKYFMGGNVQRLSAIEITNNYIAAPTPYTEMFYWGSLKDTGMTAEDLECDLTITGNVINGLANTTVSMSPSGIFPADIEFTVNGNYLVSAYDANVQATNAVGEQLKIAQKHYDLGHVTKSNHYALDYDRTIMSNEIGDVTVNDGTNVLVDETNKVVTYAYNDLVTKNESGAITVDFTKFVTLSNKYNTAVVVLSDGTEKDINTIFTYDGATLGESVTIKVYSYDKGASKTIYTVNFVEGSHVMGEWQAYTPAGCGINAVEIRYCIADECTIAEGTCAHSETREMDGTALPHQWPTSGYYNNDATCLADGTQTIYCKDCGEPDVITAPGTKVNYHKYTNYVANDDGTCMVDGTMTAVCDWCQTEASTIANPDDTKEINKDNHEYGEYIYNNDATCTANGTQTRYCINEDAVGNVCGHADETVEKPDTMIEHDWSQYVYNNDETCQNDGTETATCPGIAEENGVAPECGAKDTRVVEGTKLDACVFEDADYVLTTEATCTTPGYETAPCKFAYDGCTETHERENAEKYPINPDNHDYAKPVYQEDATCVADGTQTRTCKRDGCGHVLTETAVGTAGQGTHVWGEYVANNDSTCVADGTKTATCVNDGCTATDTVANPDDPGSKKAHTWGEYVYNNDATCVKDGTMTATCTVEGCGATDTEKDPDHLKSTVAHAWGEWTSNDDATCKKDGTETRKCTADRCYATETQTDKGSKLAHNYGKYAYNNDATYFEDGKKTAACKDCGTKKTVTATGTKLQPKKIIDTSSKFIDVNKGDWFKPAVDYAVTYGLISGITETTFEPNTVITRGMFVTILARVAGVDTSKDANAAAKTQFTDVKAGKYYSAAVEWGAKMDIVNGIDAKTFAPDQPVQRQQIAFMLYKFAKAYNVTFKDKTTVTFADASSVSNYAKEAVALCAKAGIISGYNENGKTYFKPAGQATRAEATQMIYKFHSEYITGVAK